MHHPHHLPPGWFQTFDLVGRPPAEGVLPGEWSASKLVRAILENRFPKPVPIPGYHPLVGWPRGVVVEWLRTNNNV